MKRNILILALLLCGILFGQNKNIYVEYALKINDEKDLFSTNADLRRLFSNSMSNAHHLSFALIINKSGSKFYDKQNLITDDGNKPRNSSLIFSSYNGVVFQLKDSIYVAYSSLGKGMMVKQGEKDNWVLHNETKMIDNYLCYKATTTDDIENGKGKTFHHPVIAWYCPELPYSYGPNGFSKLPGLILELQVRNVVFGVNKIDLNSELDFDSSFLSSIKTITLEELNKKIDDEMQLLKG